MRTNVTPGRAPESIPTVQPPLANPGPLRPPVPDPCRCQHFHRVPEDYLIELLEKRFLDKSQYALLHILFHFQRVPGQREVKVSQQKLARILDCTDREIRRDTERLKELGLIATRFQREGDPRSGLIYDLGPTLDLMAEPVSGYRTQESGIRRATRGASPAKIAPPPPSGRPGKPAESCRPDSRDTPPDIGLRSPIELESGSVVIDNSGQGAATATPAAPEHAVVVLLIEQGFDRSTARSLFHDYGEARCRNGLRLAELREAAGKGFKNKRGFIRDAIKNNWTGGAPAERIQARDLNAWGRLFGQAPAPAACPAESAPNPAPAQASAAPASALERFKSQPPDIQAPFLASAEAQLRADKQLIPPGRARDRLIMTRASASFAQADAPPAS